MKFDGQFWEVAVTSNCKKKKKKRKAERKKEKGKRKKLRNAFHIGHLRQALWLIVPILIPIANQKFGSYGNC